MLQIKLERIGDNARAHTDFGRGLITEVLGQGVADVVVGETPRREWCAEVVGSGPDDGFRMQFLKANVSYAEANSIGSRGVYAYYNLHEGRIYHVSAPMSWRSTDRYFCRAEGDCLVRMSKEEVEGWLKSRSESMF